MTQLVKTRLGFFVGVSPFSQIMYEFILLFFLKMKKKETGDRLSKNSLW